MLGDSPVKERSIGLFLHTRRNDYQRLQEADAVSTAHRLKLPLQVQFAENDATVQSQQIYAFVRTYAPGSAVIVEGVSDDPLKLALRYAASSAMPCFLLHRSPTYLTDLRREFPSLAMGVVTADQKDIGRIQGRQFDTLLTGSGSMLYVLGPSGSSAATDRLAGMKEVVDRSGIKYQTLSGDWTEGSSERALNTWLRTAGAGKGLALVGCQNDAMALGALRALSMSAAMLGRPELAKVGVTGVDGLPDHGVEFVDAQRFLATVVVPPVAGQALELVHRSWTTPSFVPPPVVFLPVRSYPELSRLSGRIALARGRR